MTDPYFLNSMAARSACLLGSLLLLLFSAGSAFAQPDIRLSPPEPPALWLSDDIAIQSAAQSGATSLVVWGTTINLTDTSIANLLRMQFIVDSVPQGSPVVVSDAEAEPYGVVLVLSTGKRFLVLWNDRRPGAPGIYCRTVGTDGSMGDVRLFSGGVLASDEASALVAVPAGRFLFWTDLRASRPMIYARELTVTGEGIGSERLIDTGKLEVAQRFPSLPGSYLLGRKNLPPLLLGPDGQVTTVRAPGVSPARSCHIGPDGTIAVVTDSTFIVYASLLDSLPRYAVPLKLSRYALARISVIRQDSSGYSILYPEWQAETIAWLRRRRVRVEGETVLYDSVVDSAGLAVGAIYRDAWYVSPDVKLLQRGCDGNDSVIISLRVNLTGVRGATLDPLRLLASYSVDRTGTPGHIDMNTFSYVDWPADNTFGRGCNEDLRGQRIRLQRQADRSRQSLIATVPYGARSVLVPIPVFTALRKINLTDRHPTLYLRDDTLSMAWERVRTPRTFLVGVLGFAGDSAVIAPRSFTPDTGPTPGTENLSYISSVVYQTPGGFPIIGRWSKETFSLRKYGYSGSGTNDNYTLFTPVVGWWLQASLWSHVAADYGDETYSYEPDSRTLLGAFVINNTSIRVIEVDSVRKQRHYIVGRTDAQAIMPVKPRRWLFIDSSFISLYDSTTLTLTLTGDFSIRSTYVRLLDHYLLRIYPPSGYDSSGAARDSLVNFELYDAAAINRGLLRSLSLRLPAGMRDLAVVQRPADRSLHLLCGTDDGVHHLVMDALLRPRQGDSVVSATRDAVRAPAGAFRGDTLYIAWEDDRNGASDIYGRRLGGQPLVPPRERDRDPARQRLNDSLRRIDSLWAAEASRVADSLRMADSLVTHDRSGQALRVIPAATLHMTVYPSPATDLLTVGLRLPVPGTVRLELVDMAGRLLRSELLEDLAAGMWERRWDCRTLHPGAYVMRLWLSGGSSAYDLRKVMIIR